MSCRLAEVTSLNEVIYVFVLLSFVVFAYFAFYEVILRFCIVITAVLLNVIILEFYHVKSS